MYNRSYFERNQKVSIFDRYILQAKSYFFTLSSFRRKLTLFSEINNASTNSKKTLVKKGKRGGWMRDPLCGVKSLDASNSLHHQYIKERLKNDEEEIMKKISLRLKSLHNSPPPPFKVPSNAHTETTAHWDDFDNFFEKRNEILATSKQPVEFVQSHIGSLLESIEVYNHTYPKNGKQSFLNAPQERKVPTKPKDISIISSPSKSQSLRFLTNLQEQSVQFESSDINLGLKSEVNNLWKLLGAKFAIYNGRIIPSVFPTGSVLSHKYTRTNASLFDTSFKSLYHLNGKDRIIIGDRFLTCSLSQMRVGECSYATILDSQGFILDDCYVCKLANSIAIITSSYQKDQVESYLQAYLESTRKANYDVKLTEIKRVTCLSLQGPKSSDVLDQIKLESIIKPETNMPPPNIIHSISFNSIENGENIKDLSSISFMSCFKLAFKMADPEKKPIIAETLTLRIGFTGEDGFDFIVDNSFAPLFIQGLLMNKLVKPAGIYSLDMLRMEAGLPRSGFDFSSLDNLKKASLSWLVCKDKISLDSFFGSKCFTSQNNTPPKFRRVGIISNHLLLGRSIIHSDPHRTMIGYITTCTWSPTLKCRLSQAYVKSEFALNNQKVLIATPIPTPPHIPKKGRDKLLRKGGLKKLVDARVVNLPFVPHNYTTS